MLPLFFGLKKSFFAPFLCALEGNQKKNNTQGWLDCRNAVAWRGMVWYEQEQGWMMVVRVNNGNTQKIP